MLEETLRKRYKDEKSFLITNIKDVIIIIRGLIKQEPNFSMRHIFSSHCLQLLMKFISCKYVKEFYISLFDPNDLSMNLTAKHRQNLYKYAY